MTHEVYIGRVAGQIVYVGEGRVGRHIHLNSGISNVYQANHLHFCGKHVDIEVILKPDKKSAEDLEIELIEKHQPIWNIKHTPAVEYKKALRKVFKKRPPTVPFTEQHYLVGLAYLAKDNIGADGSMLINTDFNCDKVKDKTMIHLYHGHMKTEYVTVEKLQGYKTYKVWFDEPFFDDINLFRTLSGKIK